MKLLLLILLLARPPAPTVIQPRACPPYMEVIGHAAGESWRRIYVNAEGAYYWSASGRLGLITPPPRSEFRVLSR